jgi:hypothetical protein
MKNFVLFILAILFLASCEKKSPVEEPVDKFNGYAKYLKCGEKTQNLKDKNNNIIGTVKSGIDNDANFYVKIDCSQSGKQLSKTNVFAGNKKDMPINKPNDPKEDRFPNSSNHNDGRDNHTVKVPLVNMPHCDEPGFVYSTHCKVKDNDGHEEDAWGDSDNKFHDKGCGSYDDDYEVPTNQYTIIYGTSYAQDSLRLYHLNMTTGAVTLILKEYVGNTGGTYDGTAYDLASGMFFFANVSTRELWVNNMNDQNPSFLAGTLGGNVASGTYYNGGFYYVNADFNTINKVTFTSTWQIASETVLDTIPNTITVNDIAMSPAGDYLYIVGEVDGGSTEMIKWSVAADVYYTIALNIADGSQIAYGSDANLYAIAPVVAGATTSNAYIVNPNTGVLTEISEGHIIIIDAAISDIATGPTM